MGINNPNKKPVDGTLAEDFIANLCEKGFFKLWTHPNPTGKNDKELCDCLIVFKNLVIIVSVKHCSYRKSKDLENYEVKRQRWEKKAVDKSIQQIKGAQRWLDKVDEFKRSDGRIVKLPLKKERKYYRIGIAMGADRKFLSSCLGYRLQDDSYIFDGISTNIIFNHLDTISDFIDFLKALKNDLKNKKIIFQGGGLEDLLAIYLQDNFSFKKLRDKNYIFIDDTVWRSFVDSTEYKNWQNKNEESKYWDILIWKYIEDFLTNGITEIGSNKSVKDDFFLTEIACYPREARINLANVFYDLRENGKLAQARFFIFTEYDPTKAIVFLLGSSSQREKRKQDLIYRCTVILQKLKFVKYVIGIAIDPHNSPCGYSSEQICLPRKILDNSPKDLLIELQNSPHFKGVEEKFKNINLNLEK